MQPMKERPEQMQPPPKQGSVRVTLYPLDPQAHELNERSFMHHFPDMQTYERVRQHFKWDYLAIEAWTRQGETWQPDTEYTVYSSLWRGEKITE